MPEHTHIYGHTVGLAEHHAETLHPDMAALDLAPGTPVTVIGHDDDRDLVLIDWTDQSGNPRTTTVDPAVFAEHFTEGA